MNKALAIGVEWLVEHQQQDGSWLSYSSPQRREWRPEKTYRSVFSSALILDCLCELETSTELEKIKKGLAEFLLGQRSEHWSFNYWARGSKEAKAKPYPDDLDDTFCALAALTRYDEKLIDGAAMAKIVTLLTAVEEQEGGPYRTWLVPDGSDKVWRDVDLAVNSSVAYFLSLHEVDLPQLVTLVETAIDRAKYQSPYYPSVYPIVYFISRWYRGEKRQPLRDYLLTKRQAAGDWGNELHTALSVTAWLNLGGELGEVKRAVRYLQFKQGKDGSWPAAAFCLDPAFEGKLYYAGSAALTTAFCLEALAKYRKRVMTDQPLANVAARQAMSERVELIVRDRFKQLDHVLRDEALARLDKQLGMDKDRQIRLLPYFFREALGERGSKVSDEIVEQLGAANLYGWIAYTIYDDFLDEEGKPARLPVANVCLRELTNLFSTAVPDKLGWPEFWLQVMDRLEAANAWEVKHCRVNATGADWLVRITRTPDLWPDYGDMRRLADRSLGHALGPAAILFALGFDQSSREMKQLMSWFEHYLIARQLNDDAHDWEADLRRGQINAVGAALLRRWQPKALPTTGVEPIILQLRQFFWHELITEVCASVLTHTKLARQALDNMVGVVEPALLVTLLSPIEKSANEALAKQKETLKFLAAYDKKVMV